MQAAFVDNTNLVMVWIQQDKGSANCYDESQCPMQSSDVSWKRLIDEEESLMTSDQIGMGEGGQFDNSWMASSRWWKSEYHHLRSKIKSVYYSVWDKIQFDLADSIDVQIERGYADLKLNLIMIWICSRNQKRVCLVLESLHYRSLSFPYLLSLDSYCRHSTVIFLASLDLFLRRIVILSL